MSLHFDRVLLSIRQDILDYSNKNNIHYKNIKPVIIYIDKAIKNSSRFSLLSFLAISKLLKNYKSKENDIDKKTKLLPKEQKEYISKKVDNISFAIFKYMLNKLSILSILFYVFILLNYVKYHSTDKVHKVRHIVLNKVISNINLVRSIEDFDVKKAI